MASRRLVPILLWAVVAATVGMALDAIHERVGFVGRIIATITGAAWSLATFFVVPVLVLEMTGFDETLLKQAFLPKRR
jgi:hypothetical protein